MPPVIAGIAFAAAAAAAGATAAAVIGIAIAAAVVTGVMMNALAPDAIGNSDFGSGITNAGSDVIIPVVYGKSRTGSALAFDNISGKWLNLVYIVSEGEIDGIEDIYLNGRRIPLSGDYQLNKEYSFSKTTSGFGQAIKVQVNHGSDNQGVLTLTKKLSRKLKTKGKPAKGGKGGVTTPAVPPVYEGGEWTNDHRIRGRACIAISIHRETGEATEIFSQPSLTAVVRGRKVIDIRNGQKVWSDNPALCLYDYMVNSKWGAGFNSVDKTSFIAAANYCQNFSKFKLNGTVNQAQTPRQNIDDMCSSFQGYTIQTGGAIYCNIDKPSAVVKHFDESNMIGTSVTSYGSTTDYFNQIQATFKDSADALEPYSDSTITVPPTKDKILTEDGEVKTRSFKLPFTKNKSEVDKLINIEFRRSKRRQQFSFTGDFNSFGVRPFDVITVTDKEQGWDKKKFRVVKTVKTFDEKNFGSVKFSCAEYDPWIYGGTMTGTGDKTPSGKFPNEYDVPVPEGAFFRRMGFDNAGSGYLYWYNQENFVIRESVVDWKLSTDTEWTRYGSTTDNQMIIRDTRSARYDFRIFNRNMFGALSEPAILTNVDISDSLVYPKPTGLKLVTTNTNPIISDTDSFVFSWDDMSKTIVSPNPYVPTPSANKSSTLERYMKGYEVEIYHGATKKRTEIVTDSAYEYTYNKNLDDGLSRDVTIKVKVIGKSGSGSTQATSTARNLQQPQLSGIVTDEQLTTAIIKYTRPTNQDWAGVLVHRSFTQGFTPSAATLWLDTTENEIQDTIQDATTYYYKFAAYDKFGKDGIVYSAEFKVTLKGISDYLTDIDDSHLSDALKAKIKLIDTNKTNISKEAQDRAAAIIKEQGDRTTAIGSEATLRNTADTALGKRIDTVTATTGSNTAKITAETLARSTADTALGKRIDTVTATSGSNAAKVAAETLARTNADSALSSRITTVTATANKNVADIKTEQTTRASADSALSTRITNLTTTVGSNTANISSESTARASADTALGKRIDTVVATTGSNSAAIQTEVTARTNADSALSSRINTVQTTVGKNTAAISTNTTSINGMVAKYVVQTDVNGKLAGFGLINKGLTGSEFTVQADKFLVFNGTTGESAFEVRNNKTYIKDALIGTVTANKIATGTLSASSVIKAGSGTNTVGITGSTGVAIWAGKTDKNTAPFRVQQSGKVYATDLHISGSSTFSGDITGASGTFSGTIKAGKIIGEFLKVQQSYTTRSYTYTQGGNNPPRLDDAVIATSLNRRIDNSTYVTANNNWANIASNADIDRIYVPITSIGMILLIPSAYNNGYIIDAEILIEAQEAGTTTWKKVQKYEYQSSEIYLMQAMGQASYFPNGKAVNVEAKPNYTSSFTFKKGKQYKLRMRTQCVARKMNWQTSVSTYLAGVRMIFSGRSDSTCMFGLTKK